MIRETHPKRPIRRIALDFLVVALCGVCAGGACALELRRETGSQPPPIRAGVGAACATDSVCRTGLVCGPATRTCEAPGNRPVGGGCTISAECQPDHYCTPDATCGPSGKGQAGASCAFEGDCAGGLLCAIQGFGGVCAPAGKADLGAACMVPTDCMAGLICSLGKCQSFSTIEPWLGATCPNDKNQPARAIFRVPRASDNSEDFYRLPFPNDARIKDGKVSLAGHPRPGSRYLPFDPVDRYVKAAEEDVTGFGVNQAVYFRFTRNPSVDSTRRPGAISLVNISRTSPEYGQARPHQSSVTTGRAFYACSPSLMVRPPWGAPLRGGETYAVIVTNAVTDEDATPFAPDEDFTAMLGTIAPVNVDVARAWMAYAPLRNFIAQRGAAMPPIVSAAVFTTQNVEEPIARLRRAVRDDAAPAIKSVVRCGDPGVRSPCDDGKTGAEHTRGCPQGGPASASYDEYQGTIAIPVFQSGRKPYEQPADGGAIVFEAGGRVRAQGSEDVCFSLTVPKRAAPGAGWPVVVYAHGTGGTYRSHLDSGLADDFALGDVGGGAAVPMAMFGYEGVLHGNRRGGSARPPDELVYNFLNPRAARDNALQGAADLFVVARALEGGGLPGAGGVALDRSKIALYGHSQGGNAAALAGGHEPVFGAVVMSGTGGTLVFSLLKKKKPVDIAAGVPLLVGDPDAGEDHPVLNLMQMYFERSDPVNFARRFFLEPLAGARPRHTLHVFGSDDTYSPVETQRTFGQAGGFPLLLPAIDDYLPNKITGPATGNLDGTPTRVTAAQAQFAPSGYDGHFVSTENAVARRMVRRMLGTFARDPVPTVSN